MDEPNTTTTTTTTTTAQAPSTNSTETPISPPVVLLKPEDELFKSVQKPVDLEDASKTLFQNIAAYIKGELLATSEDYKLLENMNTLATEKYKEMTEAAVGLTTFMKALQEKYETFTPYLQQIDDIDKNVSDLEKTVTLLDDYTKRLEAKFKTIDKSLLVKVTPLPTPTQETDSNATPNPTTS
eukprot:TRINITY_DN688_c0_g2_i1.p1 TRINITY_DN688_c0_g2~~TRINITY_DN688_c0_g2_i1.p1  ORF type:complete len:215 (+),score=67.18 TRINITY_DN688_c0_g2_i1:99-647(+)